MERCLGIVVVLLTAAWLACGSSDERAAPADTDAAPPSAEPAAAEPAPAAPEPPAEALSPEMQRLLDMVAWAGPGDAHDKLADSETCQEWVEADPALQDEAHPLVQIEGWLECMERLGWERRQRG